VAGELDRASPSTAPLSGGTACSSSSEASGAEGFATTTVWVNRDRRTSIRSHRPLLQLSIAGGNVLSVPGLVEPPVLAHLYRHTARISRR